MSGERISLGKLRRVAEQANRPETVYGDVQALWEQLGPLTVLALVEVVEAANDAVILEWSPQAEPLGNQQIARRARRLRKALNRFDFDGAA